MEAPWRVLTDGSVHYVGPSEWMVPPDDWAEAERRLGVGLPDDYKDLVGNQGALLFADELVIASPFDEREHLNLMCVAARGFWALACLRQQVVEPAIVSVYPEPGGLLCWGIDGGGAEYYWDCGTGDPNSWRVVAGGRPIGELSGRKIGFSITAYLAGLADGSVTADSLDGWPAGNLSIRPL